MSSEGSQGETAGCVDTKHVTFRYREAAEGDRPAAGTMSLVGLVPRLPPGRDLSVRRLTELIEELGRKTPLSLKFSFVLSGANEFEPYAITRDNIHEAVASYRAGNVCQLATADFGVVSVLKTPTGFVAPTLVLKAALGMFREVVARRSASVEVQEGAKPGVRDSLQVIPYLLSFNLGTIATYRFLRLWAPDLVFAVRAAPRGEDVRVSFKIVYTQSTRQFAPELNAKARQTVLAQRGYDGGVFFLVEEGFGGEPALGYMEWQWVKEAYVPPPSAVVPIPTANPREITIDVFEDIKWPEPLSPDALALARHTLTHGRR